MAIAKEPASDSCLDPWGGLTHTPRAPEPKPGTGFHAPGSARALSSSSHRFPGQVLTSRTSTNQ